MLPARTPLASLLVTLALSATPALAQIVNPAPPVPVPPAAAGPVATPLETPVFLNESPAAVEGIARIRELLRAASSDQAAALAARLLTEEADALVPSEAEPTVYIPLRPLIHQLILASPQALERYRATRSLAAEELLKNGSTLEVERGYWLTKSGLEATLRLAQLDLEAARFHTARMRLAGLTVHPDLKGADLRDAAALAATLARFEPTAIPLSASLRALANGPAGAAPIAQPALSVLSPLGPGVGAAPAVDIPRQPEGLRDVVARPLWSGEIGPDEPILPRWLPPTVRTVEALPLGARELRLMPTAAGDSLFVVRDSTITALDAATLAIKWRYEKDGPGSFMGGPQHGERRSNPSDWEDVCAPTVVGGDRGLVIATLSEESEREIPRQEVVAIDARSGNRRWGVTPDMIDSAMTLTVIRGPILVEGNVAIIGLRKRLPERRVAALYLAGLDLATGKTLWTVLVGSSGLLPWPNNVQTVDAGILSDGIYYRSDRLGVVCAYEATTGRAIWVRRMGVDVASTRQSPRGAPWQQATPVKIGDALFVLTPDRAQTLKLDAATGMLQARMTAEDFGDPQYLLSSGDKLIGVSDTRLSVISAADFGTPAKVQFSATVENPGIWGRVVAGADRLLVPTINGVGELPLDRLGAFSSSARLDRPGNVLMLRGGLVVADDSRILAYSDWARAQTVLSERIRTRPDDPAPPLALFDLASRTQRLPEAVDAARAGVTAIKTAQPTPEEARLKLFTALVQLIDERLAQVSADAQRPPLAPQVAELVTLLADISKSPGERATQRVLLAEQLALSGQEAAAVAACQEILDDEELASAAANTPRSSARGDVEATRRLEQLLKRVGRAAYAKQDAAAAAGLQALSLKEPVDVGALEALARRYPVASVTPEIWLKASIAQDRVGRARLAARAAEMGLQACERLGGEQPTAAGELAGRLVNNLRSRGLLSASADVLTRFAARWPKATVTLEGKAVDARTLGRELAALMQQERRPARIGRPDGAQRQLLKGWALMEPLKPMSAGVLPTFMVLQHDDGRLALMRPSGEETTVLKPAWTSETSLDRAALVSVDRAGCLFFWPGDGRPDSGPVLMRVNLKGDAAALAWTTKAMGTHFVGAARPAGGDLGAPRSTMFRMFDGVHSLNDVVIVSDERTAIMVDRSGRAVGFDMETGEHLWAMTLGVTRVTDAAMLSGRLIVAGEASIDQPEGDNVARARIEFVDSRTGERQRQVASDAGQSRWLRVTPRGDLLAGFDRQVWAIDPETGSADWKVSGVPSAATIDAWVVGESLVVLSAGQQLWQIALGSGQVDAGPLDTRGRVEANARVHVSEIDAGYAVRSDHGLLLFDRRGQLRGVDALNPTDRVTLPGPVVGGYAAVSSQAVPTEDGPYRVFNFMVFDAESARLKSTTALLLGTYPDRAATIDGILAITTVGRNTLVFPARGE